MKTRNSLAAESRLGSLVSAVRAVTRQSGGWAEVADLVADQLRLYLPGPEILTAEQRYGNPLRYECHLLHSEPDGTFSVVALVIRPGQATEVHDHVTWCVTGVIEGSEYEERFELREDWLALTGTARNDAGHVVAMAPPGDIHRVSNTGTGVVVSLNIYGTDTSRLGSSVRRVYRQPIVAEA
jgi:predicted metal-dependent enzyme (double-stranded beta helix superfamily)